MARNKAMRRRVQEMLRADYERLGTWRAVASVWDISPALAWRIVKEGYWPRDRSLRQSLLSRVGLNAKRHDWFAEPVNILRWRLIHREEMKGDVQYGEENR